MKKQRFNEEQIVRMLRQAETPPQPIQMEDILAGRAGILTCTVLAKRELVEGIRNADPYLYRDTSFPMTDTQLWAEVSHAAAVYRIDESLATHQILIESAAHSQDRQKELSFWIANAEMCLYLCKKYDLSNPIREMHESTWRRLTLRLAFLERREDLAELVRTRARALSTKEWLWYQGTRRRAVRPVVALLAWASRCVRGQVS